MRPDTTADEVDAAVVSAHAVFPEIARTTARRRAALLHEMAAALEGSRAELVAAAAAETSLSEARLSGELARTAWQLRLYADAPSSDPHVVAEVDAADAEWPAGGRPQLRRSVRPIGPVLIFAAGNFPFAFSVAGTDTAAALAAGCPVLLKVHPGHPQLSQLTRDVLTVAFAATDWPQTALTLIFGVDAGVRALKHPLVAAAAFTGSTRGGRALFDIASARANPIPFYGELSSINPVFITGAALDARRGEILAGLVASFTGSAGQLCTKPGIVAIPAGRGVEAEIADVAAAVPEQRMLTDGFLAAYLKSTESLLATPGVTTLLAPHAVDGQRAALAVVPAEQFLANAAVLQQECFGPMTLLVTYEDAGQLPRIASVLEGQLTATVHSEPGEPGIEDLVWTLAGTAGRVIHNGWPTGLAVTRAQHHGGPYPATTVPLHTSVGTHAMDRFLRPVTFQNMPEELLPPELRTSAPGSESARR